MFMLLYILCWKGIDIPIEVQIGYPSTWEQRKKTITVYKIDLRVKYFSVHPHTPLWYKCRSNDELRHKTVTSYSETEWLQLATKPRCETGTSLSTDPLKCQGSVSAETAHVSRFMYCFCFRMFVLHIRDVSKKFWEEAEVVMVLCLILQNNRTLRLLRLVLTILKEMAVRSKLILIF